jgi:hypothetical protein
VQHDGARGRCLVARLFDALSHIYFKPPQTAFSGPVFWTNQVSRFDHPPGDEDGNRGPQADLFRPDFAWAHVPAEHREFGSRRLLAQALPSPTKTLFSGILKYSYG